MNPFCSADILLPREADLRKWAVIACDQFTSDESYWQNIRMNVGNAPSTLHMILPESKLEQAGAETVANIHQYMRACLDRDIFSVYPDSYIYTERTLQNGLIRSGLVGAVDLEQYDFRPGSQTSVRATEMTVSQRLPPRCAIRARAALEFTHVLMLCDDPDGLLVEPIGRLRQSLPKLYDFELMEGGGKISGWLVNGVAAEEFNRNLSHYVQIRTGFVLAVGDGSHSLAAAKCCYEKLKADYPGQDFSRHPARFALAELVNIRDPAVCFSPIHRLLTGTDRSRLLKDLSKLEKPGGTPVEILTGTQRRRICLDCAEAKLPTAVLQEFLDRWLMDNPGRLDYIHDEGELERLSEPDDVVGFLLPAINKQDLFPVIQKNGALPCKTFSIGQAREKRYYLEGRKIQ